MKKTTIKDVALAAGVSVSTVSRVLNNKSDIHPATKEKIYKAIDALQYIPSSVARGMVLNETHTIGLILPDITNPYFASIAKGIQHKAQEYGYTVILCDTDADPDKEKDSIYLLNAKRVSGIIAALSFHRGHQVFDMKSVPLVQIDRSIPEVKTPTVTANNVLSAKRAVTYLIQQGHTQIGHLAGSLHTKTAKERLYGFRLGMQEHTLSINEDWILRGEFNIPSGKKNMSAILASHPYPTAVFCGNDLIAIGAYQAIQEANLKVPEDISIIGHDDIELASLITPSLTTMRLDQYALGQNAVDLLIHLIRNEPPDRTEIILNTAIILRNSVKKI